MDRHVGTVQHYLENPAPRKTRSDKGVSKTATARDRRRLRYNLRRKPGTISIRIFEDSGLNDVPETSRNLILKTHGKRPPLSPKHKEMRVQWGRKCTKLSVKHVHSKQKYSYNTHNTTNIELYKGIILKKNSSYNCYI